MLVPGPRGFAQFVTMVSAPTTPPLTLQLFLDCLVFFSKSKSGPFKNEISCFHINNYDTVHHITHFSKIGSWTGVSHVSLVVRNSGFITTNKQTKEKKEGTKACHRPVPVLYSTQ